MKKFIVILICLLSVTLSLYAQKIKAGDKYRKHALKEVINEAKNGEAKSQFVIGMHCFLGESLKQDSIKGLDYLNLSANQGYAPAYQELGIYWLQHGQIELAESYLKKALEHYDAENKHFDKDAITIRLFNIAAYDIIGDEELTYPNIIKYMNDKALSRYEFLANYDDDALELLMEYYGVNRNHSKTIFYGTKCYEKGIASSGFWLGQIYEYGLGAPKDLNKAITFYELGANSENNDVNQTCRYRLSEIFYDANIMDKAFKYSYDYAHNEVNNDSGTADILHRLAACYRFGRGVKQNVELANLWDALGILYYSSSNKAETMAEFENFDPDDETQVINYILNLFYSKIDTKSINSSFTTLICGIYYIFVEQNFNKAEPYIIKSYNMEDAHPEGQALSAYFLNLGYEMAPALKTEEGNNVINDFVANSGINIVDLEKDHILDDCLYRIFIEQIKIFENN